MTLMEHREEGERQSGTEPRREIEAGSALTDPARAVAALHHSGAKLDLKTIDLCFLAALYARENDTAQSCIEDDTVVDLFAQVCELVEPLTIVFCRSFFPWYNTEHRHAGIAMLTPHDVHYGQADRVLEKRQRTLRLAWSQHPERFVHGTPKPQPLPQEVWINPPAVTTTARPAQ